MIEKYDRHVVNLFTDVHMTEHFRRDFVAAHMGKSKGRDIINDVSNFRRHRDEPGPVRRRWVYSYNYLMTCLRRKICETQLAKRTEEQLDCLTGFAAYDP